MPRPSVRRIIHRLIDFTPPVHHRRWAALRRAVGATVVVATFARPAGAADMAVPKPTSQPATRRAATTQVTLSFKDVPLDTVLDYLSESAGLVIVKEVAVEGRVTLVSRQSVNADEAMLLLNTLLKVNGYAATRHDRVVQIVTRDRGKKATSVHFGADPAEIEIGDELITQVIPVSNVDAVKLRADLTAMIGTDADVTANSGSNAIVMTDTSTNVRRVVEIISALDRHESGNFELKRYVLKNANAVAATKLIIGIFKPDELKPPQQNQQQRKEATQEQALRGKINAVADERTNTIFVTGAPDTLKVIDGILTELDANPASVSQIKIIPLKYADATSAVKLLTAVFKPDEAKARNPEAPPPRPGTADQALNARVTAAADERTNSVIIAAPTDTLVAIEEILRKLDADPSSISELKVVALVNADATATAKLITSVFKPEETKPINPNYPQPPKQSGNDPLSARVNAVADDRTNSVVITAPTETLKAILDIIKVLDANTAAASNIKSFPLKYADAAAAVKLISTIFKQEDGPSPSASVQYIVRMAGVPEQASKVKITAAADDRTNTLIVAAPAESMRVIEAILKDLEANPASEEAIFIYRLKNGQAGNLEPILNAVFGNGTSATGSGQRQNRNGNTQQVSGTRNGVANRSGPGTGSGNSRGLTQSQPNALGVSSNANGTNQGGVGGGLSSANLSPAAQRLASELAGQVSFTAEPDTNSLIVNTSIKFQDRVKSIIQELDRPVPQVLIKVLIAEVSHDNSEDIGVDFSVLNQRANGRGEKFGTNFGVAAATGGLVVNFVENNVNITLRALATAGKLDVLSRPYILASDNQLASITVGQEVPFITDSRTTDLGQTINTIQYQDIGIILNVTPHINSEGLVIMDVAPEISQLTGTSVPISAQVNAPVFAKRSAQSRVAVRDGQTIVIGGLMEDRKTLTLQKVPLLGDIPFLGLMFQRTQTTKTKTELLIFLTPHVAQQPDALRDMTRDEMKGTQLTPNAVSPGTFDSHLRGMDRGQSAPATQPLNPSDDFHPVFMRPNDGVTPTTSPALTPATLPSRSP